MAKKSRKKNKLKNSKTSRRSILPDDTNLEPQNWIFTPPEEFRLAFFFFTCAGICFLISETHILSDFIIKASPGQAHSADELQSIHGIRWLARIIGAFFCVLSFPKVVIAPFLNFRTLLRVKPQRKGLFAALNSIFPVGYEGTLRKSLRYALKEHPCPIKAFRIPRISVQTLPIHRKIYLEPYHVKKSMIFDIMLNFDSSPPVLSVCFYVTTDEEIVTLENLGWPKTIRQTLLSKLSSSSFPYIQAQRLKLYVMSYEEIIRAAKEDGRYC